MSFHVNLEGKRQKTHINSGSINMECIHVNQQSLCFGDLKAIVTQALEEVFCVTEEWQHDPRQCRARPGDISFSPTARSFPAARSKISGSKWP